MTVNLKRTAGWAATVFFGVCVLLFCSCVRKSRWYAADSVRPKLPQEVNFNKEAGHGESLFVTLQLENRKDLLFDVDTGSPITILDKSLESMLGEPIEKRKVRYAWFGNATVGIHKAPKLYLGNTQLRVGHRVWTDDLSRLPTGRPIMGILGMDCLQHYCVQLDFVSSKMRFLDPDHQDQENLGRAFSLSISQAGVTIQGNLLDIEGAESGVDSAEYLDGALKSKLFQRESLQQEVLVRQWKDSLGIPRREARFPKGMFSGETYSDLILRDNPSGNNLIGLRFLARHLVTFNFPKGTMYLKRTDVGPLVN